MCTRETKGQGLFRITLDMPVVIQDSMSDKDTRSAGIEESEVRDHFLKGGRRFLQVILERRRPLEAKCRKGQRAW
jgi:hypothetical protein